MNFNINKPSFSAAIKRMQSAFTLQHCLGVVTHRLSRMGNVTLMSDLSEALGHLDDERGIDRKRASELLSRTLTGESYNVLASKMKQNQEPATLDLVVGNLRGRLGELDAVIFTAGHEGEVLRKTLIDALLLLIKDKAEGKVGDATFLTERKEYLPDANFFWGSLHALLTENNVVKVLTEGFDAPTNDHHGLEHHKREVIFWLSDESKIALHYDFSSSEYTGVDELSCVIYINEDDIYEFFDSSETHDDDFVENEIIESFGDGISGKFCDASNQDLVDLETATNKSLLNLVLPELAMAFSHKV